MSDGIVTYGIVGLPASLDPHNQVIPNDFATRVAFDSLLMPEDGGGLQPWLAESYRPIDVDCWEFVLREGLRFASGRPLDAAAVAWSFERAAANPRLLAAARIPTFERAEVLDASRVRFHTKGPDVIWPRRVLQVVVADPQELPFDEIVTDPGPLAGSGLFAINGFEPGQLVRHDRVAATWRGEARIAGFTMVPHDPASLYEALVSKRASFGYLSGVDVERAVGEGLVLQRILQANVHMIRFNSTVAPFDDVRLREAVSLATDYRRVVAERYLGGGRAADQLVGEECFGYDPSIGARPHDPARARRLVEESGFAGELSFDILASSAVLRPWGEEAVRALNEIGLRTHANLVDLPVYLGKLAANDPPRGDLIGAGNQYGPGLDAEFSLNKFSSKLPAGQVEYDNAEFQAIYDASQIELDAGRREEMLRACTRLLLADFGCVPAYQPALSWLVDPALTGVRFNTSGAGWIDWRDAELLA